MAEKKITLSKLMSYIASISSIKGDNVDNVSGGGGVGNTNADNYTIAAFKNDLADSPFKLLKFGEVNTVGDLPKKLKKIFDPYISDMKRIGVIAENSKKDNISLLYSILYCIKADFMDLSNSDKAVCIDQLVGKMVMDLYSKKLFEEFEYKNLGWIKKELEEAIVKYKNNILTLRFLSDYLNLNIFMFNVNEDNIYAIYPEESYNTYKPAIFLSFFNNVFEPIIYKNEKIWRHDLDPLKKLISIDKKFIGILNDGFSNKSSAKTEKLFAIASDDLSRYLNKIDEATKKVENTDDADKPVNTVVTAVTVVVKKDDSVDQIKKVDNNEYDEVYIEHPNTEVYINDPEGSDAEIETAKNDQDIFCVKSEHGSDSEDDGESKTVGGKTINAISLKMKITELQKVATDLEISIDKGKFKNGKSIMKTKNELYDDLLNKIKATNNKTSKISN